MQVKSIALGIVENQAMLGSQPLDRFDHGGICGVPDVHENVDDAGVSSGAQAQGVSSSWAAWSG